MELEQGAGSSPHWAARERGPGASAAAAAATAAAAAAAAAAGAGLKAAMAVKRGSERPPQLGVGM